MTAMAPKRDAGKWEELVYIDLLAGPGLGIDRETGIEFDGSPIRIAKIVPAFDRLFFSDLNQKNIATLRSRMSKSDLERVDFHIGDCNAAARRIVGEISRRTLGLAFIDPEGFEAKFRLFQALASKRIDVLFLFPSGIGIRRNLAAFAKQARSPMDDLWGGREWRDLAPAKLAAGARLTPEDALTLDRPWVLGFRSKMVRIGFSSQDEADPCFSNEKNVPMYHLLFFSQDAAGLKIWRAIKRIEPSGQRALPFSES